jgi:hypothetical protein
MTVVTTLTKTGKCAKEVTENVPNLNSDAATINAYQVDGDAITTMIAVMILTKLTAKTGNAKKTNSSVPADIVSRKNSDATVVKIVEI